eukprot:340194_1
MIQILCTGLFAAVQLSSANRLLQQFEQNVIPGGGNPNYSPPENNVQNVGPVITNFDPFSIPNNAAPPAQAKPAEIPEAAQVHNAATLDVKCSGKTCAG